MVLTADEVIQYSNITAPAGQITSSGLIGMVQAKIIAWTNNNFTTDYYCETSGAFDGSNKTLSGSGFTDAELASGDDVYIYGTIRNNGIKEIATVTNSLITFTTASSVITEAEKVVLVELVKWPEPVKYAAAQMVAYDYDIRPTITPGVRSRSLGPFSESYTTMQGGVIGSYPIDIMDALTPYKILRLD